MSKPRSFTTSILPELTRWQILSRLTTPGIRRPGHPNVGESANRLLKVSASGQILKVVNLGWSPSCLRIDRSDGSVWVTGCGISRSAAERALGAIEKITGTLPLGKTIREFLMRRRSWPRTQKHDSAGKVRASWSDP